MSESNNSCCSNEKDRKISCSVTNCVYHKGESVCSAHQIDVGPSFACSCQDTICGTFTPNDK